MNQRRKRAARFAPARFAPVRFALAWLAPAWFALAWFAPAVLVLVLPCPVQAAPAAGRAEAESWAFLPWDECAGRIEGRQADSEGPKAFAVKPDGGVLVLDQVNSRVIDLDAAGGLVGYIELPAPTFDDLEQVDGWAILALDRLVGRSLLVMDRHGVYLTEIDVQGRGIERAGLVTALLPRADGVWLEVRHRYSVKVLDSNLRPCTRQIVLGRPVDRGRSLHGALNHGGVRLWTDRRNARSAVAEVALAGRDPIRRIVLLDEDPEGTVHAVLHEALFSPQKPFRVENERYLLIALDDRLNELSRLESPWVLTLYDQRVEFRVGPAGRLWQMAFCPDGVLFVRWDWRAP